MHLLPVPALRSYCTSACTKSVAFADCHMTPCAMLISATCTTPHLMAVHDRIQRPHTLLIFPPATRAKDECDTWPVHTASHLTMAHSLPCVLARTLLCLLLGLESMKCHHLLQHCHHLLQHCHHLLQHYHHVLQHCHHVLQHCHHLLQHCHHVLQHCHHILQHCHHLLQHCHHVL